MKQAMRITTAFVVALGSCATFPAIAAGKYDGSSALVCAAVVVHECAAGERCQAQAAENVGLPTLMRLDFAGMKVRPLDAAPNRDSPMRNVNHVNGRTVINGGESGRGWIVTIHEQTGKMTAAVVTDGEGYVIFGQCGLP